MKAALLVRPGEFGIRNLSDPKIENDTDVLVRVKAVGICGSDIHYFTTGRIGDQVVKYPFIVGHEVGGIVERVGSGVKSIKPGQRVVIDPAVSCGKCDQCRAGRENTCRELLFLGAPGQMEGAMREFLLIPDRNCFPVNDKMTFEQAALCEPLAIAVYAVIRSPLTESSSAAILGVGPIGLSILHVIRTRECGNIFVTDKTDDRLGQSSRLHPSWLGNPDRVDVVKEIFKFEPHQLDIVFECSGDPAAIMQGIDLLKPGGTLMIVGIPEVDDVSIPIHQLRRKEIAIVNIRRQLHTTQEAIDLIAARKIDVDPIVTHRFALNEAQRAFELVSEREDGVMKAMILID